MIAGGHTKRYIGISQEFHGTQGPVPFGLASVRLVARRAICSVAVLNDVAQVGDKDEVQVIFVGREVRYF